MCCGKKGRNQGVCTHLILSCDRKGVVLNMAGESATQSECKGAQASATDGELSKHLNTSEDKWATYRCKQISVNR